MFDYLTAPMGVGRHRIRLPRYPYVQTGLKANLLKHQAYYSSQLQRVDSRHLLVRLIQSSPLPWSAADRSFLDATRDLMYEVANALDLTSNVSRGKVQYPGAFYGLGVSEAIMVHDTPFDHYLDWREMRPVHVHRHPVTGLHLQPLDGETREASGWAAISINYPMLMWTFRQWRLSNDSFIEDYQLSVAHFVMMVVLPGMMGSHLDGVVFNRMYNDLFELKDRAPDEKSAFYLIDYQSKLDESLEEYLSQVGRKSLSLEDLLSSIPTIHHDTYYGMTHRPDVIVNSQTRWWDWVAYMPVLKVWCAYDYLTENRRNRTEQKDLLKTIVRTQRSRWLPEDLAVEMEIDFVLLTDWLTA